MQSKLHHLGLGVFNIFKLFQLFQTVRSALSPYYMEVRNDCEVGRSTSTTSYLNAVKRH